jgi:hypothetical protein
VTISPTFFCAKTDQLLRIIFSIISMAERICQKSTKVWKLVQKLKCKVSIKISAQFLVKHTLNARISA